MMYWIIYNGYVLSLGIHGFWFIKNGRLGNWHIIQRFNNCYYCRIQEIFDIFICPRFSILLYYFLITVHDAIILQFEYPSTKWFTNVVALLCHHCLVNKTFITVFYKQLHTYYCINTNDSFVKQCVRTEKKSEHTTIRYKLLQCSFRTV